MIRLDFLSLTTLADYVTQRDTKGASKDGSISFCHCSFDEAIEYARHGWPEGANKAKALLDRLTIDPPSAPHSQTYHDVSGSYVDVGEFVQGVPECMVDFREDKRPARFAHIVVAACYAASFRASSAIQRGVTIAAIIDALEAQGIRCTVDLHFTVKNESKTDQIDIHLALKEAHAPLNLDTLTFGIAHPAYLRRLIFGAMEHLPRERHREFSIRSGGGYGKVAPIPVVPGAIMFNMPNPSEDWSEQRTIERIQEALAATLTGRN